MGAQERYGVVGILSSLGRSWWVLLLYGLLGVLFGLIAVTRPVAAAAALAWALGVMALAEGLVSLLALFDKQVAISKGWLAVYAVVSIVFGLLTVFNPVATASILLLFLAAWLIVAGVYRIVFAIRVRKEIEGEWLIALSGLLAIALGVLYVLNPVGGLAVTTIWIGAAAIVYGVLQIIAAFKVRRLNQFKL
ncbi:hypothetical protein ARC20_16220 [Stenotrophomonas panacihumi]|uniref:HdeD family acid-resistance protein n=1 Tax=Stenotrophomonas panacihumi TaxID=676599 RepID=A0A0R0A6T5_9GAMM|nr:DUF308 domain-containing protein [Stenotrophomonas panacihumi]KRG37770.1 hypothetical protein ARC20_16220 [Stenotrophomonas panacihumi]PTN56294.1 hypothetical protein C9J98_00805 [Stenotrophomonas panacihumi]